MYGDDTDLAKSIDQLNKVYVWQLIIEHIFRGLSSIYVLVIVLFIRKRKEIFFWSIPAFFVIDNVLGLIPACALMKNGSGDNYDDYSFHHYPVVLQVANSCFLLAHWVFSV